MAAKTSNGNESKWWAVNRIMCQLLSQKGEVGENGERKGKGNGEEKGERERGGEGGKRGRRKRTRRARCAWRELVHEKENKKRCWKKRFGTRLEA